MYPVSDKFLTAIASNARQYRWSGTITTKGGKEYPFDNEDIVKGSGYITRSCCGNAEIELGTVYASEMGISLFSNIDRYSLDGATVRMYFHLALPDGTEETVPMGVFEVSEANRTTKTLEIKAYDYMLRFDKPLSVDYSNGTPYNYLSVMCTECGVTMAQTQAQINALTNGTATLGIYIENDIVTFRDLLYYVAQVVGCVAQINRFGKLELIPYKHEPDVEMPQTHRFDSNYSDFVTRYTAVSSSNLVTEEAEYYGLEVDDALTMNLGVNPLLQFGLVATRERLLRAILNAIAAIEYVPCDVTVIGNPALDPMDVIRFTGGHADDSKMSCITSITYNINGKHKIKCVGKNPKLAAAKSTNDKNITALMNQVEEKKTVVYSFVNVAPYDIESNPFEILNIDYISKETTSAMFLAEILLNVTATEEVQSIEGTATYDDETQKAVVFNFTQKAAPELTVTYKLNGTEIATFKPKQVYREGRQILTLFLPLTDIIENSTNSFAVLLNVENGTATIGAEQIRATISGQGLVAGIGSWNGRISITDEISAVTLEAFASVNIENVHTAAVVSQPNISRQAVQQVLTEIAVSGFSAVMLDGINERVTAGEVIKTATISTEYDEGYFYNRIFITTENNTFALRTSTVFNGAVATIDSGLITAVQIPFENYETVTGLEVSE